MVKFDLDGVKFITLRQRGKNLFAELASSAPESGEEITLKGTERKYTKVRVHNSVIQLPELQRPFRQLTLTEHGQEKPALIITNEWQWDSVQITIQ